MQVEHEYLEVMVPLRGKNWFLYGIEHGSLTDGEIDLMGRYRLWN